MPANDEDKTFTSPIRKLVRFFRCSRDGWKEKCRTAKAHVKPLKNAAYALRKSPNEWKERSKRQEAELNPLRRELDEKRKGCNCCTKTIPRSRMCTTY